MLTGLVGVGLLVAATHGETRRPIHFGFGLGAGVMRSANGPIQCVTCEHKPLTGAGHLRIGWLWNPSHSLGIEVDVTSQTLDADKNARLNQTIFLVTLQRWFSEPWWGKVGVGYATLFVDIDDGVVSNNHRLDEGVGGMTSVGYEFLPKNDLVLDVELRVGFGYYQGSIGDTVVATTLRLGVSWY